MPRPKGNGGADRRVTRKRYCETCRFARAHFIVWDTPKLTILVCGGCERTHVHAIL